MQEEIFGTLKQNYRTGIFTATTIFHFTVGDKDTTVTLDSESCSVAPGKPDGAADCTCSINRDIFERIWREGYRPGVMDFMTGKIKADAPHLLLQFMQAFAG